MNAAGMIKEALLKGTTEAERFRLLVEAVTDSAIFMLDPNGIVVSWNAGAERIKGYEAREIVGRSFSTFYEEADRQAGIPERVLGIAARDGKFQTEGWRVRKDGSRFWAFVIIDAIYDNGELVGFAKITRDLTERRESEEELRRSEELFRRLVEGVTDYAIYMLDPHGRVLTWNRGAERIKGYCGEEILGMHISCFYGPEDRRRGLPESALETARAEGRFEEDGWRVRKDGSPFWATVLITAMYTDEGGLRGFSKVTRDISERKRAEEALKASLADKDVLMRELAHRTKNNMQVIGSLLGLQAAVSADDAFARAVSETQDRIRAMALVHENLYQSHNIASLNMKDYVEDLMDSLIRAHKVRGKAIQSRLDTEDLFFSIDAALPCGLIINELVSNSLKHAFPEGKCGSLFLSLRRVGEKVELRYRDDGRGLPRDLDLSRIKSLGLKLVYNLSVRQLRGTMEVRRDPVSEFVFTFENILQKEPA